MMKKLMVSVVASIISFGCVMDAQNITVYSDTLAPVFAEASFIPESEEDVMFAVRLPDKNGLSDEVAELLNNKVVQILGRCNAGASGKQDVFVIEPVVTLDGERKSEGLVRNVTSVNGELSLTARHRYSDAIFYNTVVPLNAAVKGSNANSMQLLVKAIRPADAAYVRFIKNARKNAFEFGLLHPEIYEIPEQQDKKADDVPSLPGDTVAAEDSPLSVIPTSSPVAQPSDGSLGEIYLSQPGLKVALANCVYDAATRSINIQLRVTNTDPGAKGDNWTEIRKAMDANGGSYQRFTVDDRYHSFPYDVPVAVNCSINDVYSNPMKVPYVEIQLGKTMVEIRNMIVKEPQQ